MIRKKKALVILRIFFFKRERWEHYVNFLSSVWFILPDKPFMVTEKDPQDSFRELFSCSVIYLVYQRYFCRLGNWATCYLNLKCFLHFFPRHISMSIQYIGLVCEELVSVIVIKLLLSLCRLSSEESIIVLLQICCSVMLILFGTLFSATSRF